MAEILDLESAVQRLVHDGDCQRDDDFYVARDAISHDRGTFLDWMNGRVLRPASSLRP